MVRLRILLLWILPALCLSAGPTISAEMMKKYLVHTYEKLGHRYMIEIDNDKTDANALDNFIYKAIGVAMYNTDKYSYSEYHDDKKEQPIIYPFSGAAISGNDAFQLVHTDFKNIQRVSFKDFKADSKKCADPIKNGENFAMLYLETARNDQIPDGATGKLKIYNGPNIKRVGTYFGELDLYKFVNDKNELQEVRGVGRLHLGKDAQAKMKASRFEILCRVEHKYATVN